MKIQINAVYVGVVMAPSTNPYLPLNATPQEGTQLEIVEAKINSPGSVGDAEITWRFLNADDVPVKYGSVKLTEEEYQAWNADEPYLMDLVVEKLGVTPV